jgi:hypothetical protein
MRELYVRDVATKQQAPQLLQPTALLFINLCFKQISASHLLRSYFQIHGYSITTTFLRKMFETETEHLRSKGLINSQQQESVNRVIGHSPQTARKKYIIPNDNDIRKQRQDDVNMSTRIMEQFDNPSERVNIDFDEILRLGKL